MVDTALRKRLDGFLFLSLVGVSLLAGVAFGRPTGNEPFYAIVSFVVLGLILLVVTSR